MKTILLTLSLLCCGIAVFAQTPEELAASSGIPVPQIQTLAARCSTQVKQLTLRSGESEITAAGVMAEVPSGAGWAVVEELYASFRKDGFLIFVSEENFGMSGKADRVAILRSNDQMDILRLMQTAGPGYNLTNTGVVEQIKKWDSAWGIIILGAGKDWLKARIVQLPPVVRNLAKEIYRFSRDTVEHGSGTVDALAEQITATSILYLWWN